MPISFVSILPPAQYWVRSTDVRTYTEGNKPICNAAINKKPSSGRTSMMFFYLTIDCEDVFVEAPSSRGAHHKIKPVAVLVYNKYKTGVDRSDQMLAYYSFEMMIKWWKKLSFHLFDLVVVNAHILHNKQEKCHWKFSMKKSPKDCSLVPAQKFKCKVRLAVQLADL
jgi:hypothetical protein